MKEAFKQMCNFVCYAISAKTKLPNVDIHKLICSTKKQ